MCKRRTSIRFTLFNRQIPRFWQGCNARPSWGGDLPLNGLALLAMHGEKITTAKDKTLNPKTETLTCPGPGGWSAQGRLSPAACMRHRPPRIYPPRAAAAAARTAAPGCSRAPSAATACRAGPTPRLKPAQTARSSQHRFAAAFATFAPVAQCDHLHA